MGLLMLCACAEPTVVPATEPGPSVELGEGVERRDLRFACGDTTCAAWLFLPKSATPPPVVVMAHGFAGTRDVALPEFARRFASAGVAALVFDYRYFGASGGAPRQLVDPWRQAEDWQAALAFARRLDAVDGSRVALFGTSLGAGHALATAADDGGVRAVVAQVPLIDTAVEGESGFYGMGWLARLLLTGWADLALEKLTGATIEIPAIAPATGFGMIVDDAAASAFESVVPSASSYRNAVVAHSVFTFDDWNPGPRAASLRIPILLVASRRDRFAPFAAVEALAARAPDVTIAEIDGDHFDVYSPPLLEQAAAIETRYLVEKLGAAEPVAP